MLSRFAGRSGRRNRIEAIKRQAIVGGDKRLAKRFDKRGKLVEIGEGDVIIEQGGSDDDIYMILHGSVDVYINGGFVVNRPTGEAVGDMAAIDPQAQRAATVKAHSPCVALKVSAKDFCAAGATSVHLWKALAQRIGSRLRERSRFHLPPNPKPVLFIGSASESLAVAEHVRDTLLVGETIDARLWNDGGIFGPSRTPLEELMKQVEVADFALLVCGADDKVTSRGDEKDAPRDNVIFEMGLFIGRIGRDRVFILNDRDANLKLPSDLTGHTPITYRHDEDEPLDVALSSACDELRRCIDDRGAIPQRLTLAPRGRDPVDSLDAPR